MLRSAPGWRRIRRRLEELAQPLRETPEGIWVEVSDWKEDRQGAFMVLLLSVPDKRPVRRVLDIDNDDAEDFEEDEAARARVEAQMQALLDEAHQALSAQPKRPLKA